MLHVARVLELKAFPGLAERQVGALRIVFPQVGALVPPGHHLCIPNDSIRNRNLENGRNQPGSSGAIEADAWEFMADIRSGGGLQRDQQQSCTENTGRKH